VETKRQQYLEAGWSAVEVLPQGAYFAQWQHEKRTKSKGGKVFLTVSARGEVEAHEGWLPTREAKQKDKGEAAPTPPRREVSAPLQNYLDLHRHAAVRAKLLDHPGVALRLMVAHAVVGSGLWSVKREPQRTDRASIAESVETSKSEAIFDQGRRTVLALLDMDPEALSVTGSYGDGLAALFQRLLALSNDELLSILVVVMGETLEAGSATIEAVGIHIEVDMAEVWSADDAFFDLVRDKALLTSMVAEVAGSEVAAANAGAKGAILKEIIRDCLDGSNGRSPVERWVPACLRAPMQGFSASPAPDTLAQ